MNIAAYSITDLRSALSVLRALGVEEGMVFEVPRDTFNAIFCELENKRWQCELENNSWQWPPLTSIKARGWGEPYGSLVVNGVKLVPNSRLNFHRYKNKLFRVLPSASSIR